MTGFLSIGNMSIDDLVFADGTTQWRMPGGNAVYAALGMALWGVRPGLLAPHGPDYPVEALADRIDLSPSRRTSMTLRNWGLYENDGSRTFVFRRETRDWVRFCPTVDDIRADAIGACHIAPLPFDRQAAMVAAVRARGAHPISVDLDDRHAAAIPYDALGGLIRAVDAFLPSRQDAEAVFPGTDPTDALRRFRAMAPGTEVIGIKLGADGVILHRAGTPDILAVPAASSAIPVDATGAGDAFCGGFLVGYADGGDMTRAALMGSVSASFAIAALGTAGLLRAAQPQAGLRLAQLAPRASRQPL